MMLAETYVAEDSPNPLGEFITQRRKHLKLSQRALAEKSGISQSYLSFIEAGLNPKTKAPTVPGMEVFDGLARALRVSRDSLVRIWEGEDPELVLADRPMLRALPSAWEPPTNVSDPPDEWEVEVLKRIGAFDFGDLDPRRDPEFWHLDRATRRRRLRNFEDIWLEEEARRRRESPGRA